MSKREIVLNNIRLDKLVHGGQCLAAAPDGKKLFIWGGLPGEAVDVLLTKSRKTHAEGFVTTVHKASEQRIGTLGQEDINISIQPWSIMEYDAELEAKRQILEETFAREGVNLQFASVEARGSLSAYRNKVEFSFWGDDEGLHYAHYLRATHRKIRLEYPYHPLIPDQMAAAAEKILHELNEQGIRAGDLKSLILRVEQSGKVVAALFVKTKDFPKLESPDMAVVYSDPKSPASIKTELLYTKGDITLTDTLLGKNITYDVFSFFQINLLVFEAALKAIERHVSGQPSIDMYSGVGSIGLSVGSDTLVETDESSVAMARHNAEGADAKVVHTDSEKALEHIVNNKILIVDPPRAGLHQDVVDRILEVGPPKVIYLSCNPSTQARDIKLLAEKYKITFNQGYNFFPRTPHIESLLVLERI